MKISAVSRLACKKFTRTVPAKRACEKHMLEVEESSARLYFTSTLRDRPSCNVPVKLSAWRILSVTFLPFMHAIYTLITHKSKRGYYLERKPQISFYNTIHPSFRGRATHHLERNHCSLFSFPLPLSYLERRFVPKHNSHLYRVWRVFWNLGSIWDLQKEADKAWQMQWGGIVGFGKLVKTKLREVHWQKEFRGFKYIG